MNDVIYAYSSDGVLGAYNIKQAQIIPEQLEELIADSDKTQAQIKYESNPEIAEPIEGQVNIFNARRQSIEGQSPIMRQGIAQIQEIARLQSANETKNIC